MKQQHFVEMTLSKFDPKPMLAPTYIYVMLLSVLAVSAVLDLFVAPSIYWSKLYMVPVMASVYWLYMAFMANKFGDFEDASIGIKAMRLVAELMLISTLTSVCLPLLDQMTKIFAFPLADAWLVAADEFIGFDWFGYLQFVHDRPWLITILDTAYLHTGNVALFLTVILILTQNYKRLQFHLESAVWVGFISILISTFTPAVAAAAYYLVDFSAYPNFGGTAPGMYHLESLRLLREASPDYLVGEEPFKGLVTFPSVHTALGVLFAGAVWRHWLFWPFAIYAIIMIPSTPVFGSHYLIDVIGGIALTLLVMWVVAQRKAYAGVFTSPAGVRTPIIEPT